MGELKLSMILKYAGVLTGIVCTIALIAKHPIIITLEIIGASVYFVGYYLEKENQ